DLAESFDAFDVETVEASELEVARPEDVGIERWALPWRCDALDTATHLDEAGSEPACHVETVNHVGGMTQMLADSSPIRGRPVGDDHLDSLAPTMALSGQKPRQGLGVAAADHPEAFAGLAVD